MQTTRQVGYRVVLRRASGVRTVGSRGVGGSLRSKLIRLTVTDSDSMVGVLKDAAGVHRSHQPSQVPTDPNRHPNWSFVAPSAGFLSVN